MASRGSFVMAVAIFAARIRAARFGARARLSFGKGYQHCKSPTSRVAGLSDFACGPRRVRVTIVLCPIPASECRVLIARSKGSGAAASQ
jgi:hypothetical protein